MIRTRMHFFEHSSFIDDRPGCHRNGPWKQTSERAKLRSRWAVSPLWESSRLNDCLGKRPWRAARLGVVGARVAVAVMSTTLPPKKPEYVGLATPFFATLSPRPHAMFHSSRTCVVCIYMVIEDAVARTHTQVQLNCGCRERKVGCHGGCEHATRGAARCTAWPSRMVYSRRVRHMLLAPIATSLLLIHHFLCLHAPSQLTTHMHQLNSMTHTCSAQAADGQAHGAVPPVRSHPFPSSPCE
jgi:hypothetical protein